MKIAIMGAGAIGCYLGAALHRAGREVHLVARGEHLRALQAQGLRLESPLLGNHHLHIPATGDPAQVGPADLVIFLVKAQHTLEAGRQMAPMVGPDTAILSLQNGVENEDVLAGMYGPGRTLAGMCSMGAALPEPGRAVHSGGRTVRFGEYRGAPGGRTERIRAALQVEGLEVSVADDVRRMLWEKFCYWAAGAGLCALTDTTGGPMRRVPEMVEMYGAAMREAWQVGRALGVGLPDDYVQRRVDIFVNAPGDMFPSMLQDRRKGKPLELDALTGVVRLGKKAGVPTPIFDVICACLTLYNKQVSA